MQATSVDHTQACPYCPKYDGRWDACSAYATIEWINRIGGCPLFPFRDLPRGWYYLNNQIVGLGKVGQQKQRK